MKKTRENIEVVISAFKLGELTGWRTATSDIDGFKLAIFNTTKETNLKYYFKL